MLKVYFLLFLTNLVFAKSEKPSFDCKKARSNIEKQICKNSTLAKADKSLAVTFEDLKKNFAQSSRNFESIKISQKEWLKNRELCYLIGTSGEEESCLKDASTAKFPYWDAHYVDQEKLELLRKEPGCTFIEW